MFCTNCGQNLAGSPGKFCTKCGTSKSESTGGTFSSNVSMKSGVSPSQQPAAKLSGRNMKTYAVFAILAVVLISALFFTGVIGGHELQGRWVSETGYEFPVTITFTRNRFTIIQYSGWRDIGVSVPISQHPPWRSSMSASELNSCGTFEAVPHPTLRRSQRRPDGELMDIRFQEGGLWRVTQSGRWYISDDRLELVFDCGAFNRMNFELRRDNVLILGATHFRQ